MITTHYQVYLLNKDRCSIWGGPHFQSVSFTMQKTFLHSTTWLGMSQTKKWYSVWQAVLWLIQKSAIHLLFKNLSGPSCEIFAEPSFYAFFHRLTTIHLHVVVYFKYSVVTQDFINMSHPFQSWVMNGNMY